MKNLLPGADPMGRRRAASAAPASTEVLPSLPPTAPAAWEPRGPAAPGAGPAPVLPYGGPPFEPEADGAAETPEADDPAHDEPFVPKSRYVMGRSTKVLVCVALVSAGMFAGSAVQKQIDAGTRASRGTFGTVQNPGAGTGNGTGNATPGQGRRGGGTAGSGTAGGGTAGSGAGAPSTAPAQTGSR